MDKIIKEIGFRVRKIFLQNKNKKT